MRPSPRTKRRGPPRPRIRQKFFDTLEARLALTAGNGLLLFDAGHPTFQRAPDAPGNDAIYLSHGADVDVVLSSRRAAFSLSSVNSENGSASIDWSAPSTASMSWLGANPSPRLFVAGGPSNQPDLALMQVADASNAAGFERLVYDEIYHGVDLAFYFHAGHVEFDWIVAPGADPSAISMVYSGVERLSLDDAGNLVIQAAGHSLVQHAPVSYQIVNGQRQSVASGYRLASDGIVTFSLGDFDRSVALVIDPILSYSSYLGGRGNEFVSDIAVSKTGETYIIGTTNSPDLDGNSGPDTGTDRAFIAKLDSNGGIEGAAVLGPTPQFDGNGFAGSIGYAVDVTPSGKVIVVYETFETGVMTLTAGGLLPLSGEHYLHVVQLTDGAPTFDVTMPVFSSPGIFAPFGFGSVELAIDSVGAAYVAYSAFRPTAGGGAKVDPYLTKVTPTGGIEFTQSLYGSIADIAVDREKNIYLALSTDQDNLPTTLGALQPNVHPNGFAGSTEIWVAMLDPTATALLGATYFGGSENDTVNAIAVDPNSPGSVYLVGKTTSPDFPLKEPFQFRPFPGSTLGANVRANGFMALIDLEVGVGQPEMRLISSTYLGGSREEYLSDVAIDSTGNVYVAGGTNSPDFPNFDALQPTFSPGPLFDANGSKIGVTLAAQDLVFAKFDRLLSKPEFITFFGGSGQDVAPFLAIDQNGAVHVAATSAGEMYSPLVESFGRLVARTNPFVVTADFPTALAPNQQQQFGGGDIRLGLPGNLATDAVVLQFTSSGLLTGRSSNATLGRDFNDVVAEFTSFARNARSSDFTATIDWGDGEQSAGVIRPAANDPRRFLVYGKHRYQSPGVFPVVAHVEDHAANSLPPAHNINLSNFDLGQTGGVIAINPTNPTRFFAAMSDEHAQLVAGLPSDGGIVVATSLDSGKRWSPRRLGDGDGPPELLSKGSPDALFDTFGNLFVAYRGAQSNEIVVAMSTDGGVTFDPKKAVHLSAPGSSPDPNGVPRVGKPKLAFSAARNEIWVAFGDIGSDQIFAAVALVSGPGNVGGFDIGLVTGSHADGDADIAVGPDGTVVVMWDTFPSTGAGDGLWASYDVDGIGTGIFSIPSAVDSSLSDAEFRTAAQRSTVGVDATLAWDNTNGPHRGRLYAAYIDLNDQVPGTLELKELTLFTTFSDNAGATWSTPRRVTLDPKFQSMFLPSIALDPETGNIAVGWYGTYGPVGTVETTARFYVATSNDGEMFSEAQAVSNASSNAIAPELSEAARSVGYGDAPGMAFWDGQLYPIWSDNSDLEGHNRFEPQFEVATSIIGVIQVKYPPVAINPMPIRAVAGVTYSGPVATFSHPDVGLAPHDFFGTTTIYWGDGSQSSGSVSQPNGPGTDFVVSGTHTYADAGAYPLWISVLDQRHHLPAIPVSNVTAQQDSQAEGTIAIDPTNPDRVFAAGVHASPDKRGIPFAISDDGGATWALSNTLADGRDGLPRGLSDPKAAFDQFGNLFLTYITPSPEKNVVVALSTDGGFHFSLLKVFHDIDTADQPSIAVGPGERGAEGSVWLTWERGGAFQIIMAAGAPVHGLGVVGGFGEFPLAPVAADNRYRNFGDIAVGPNGQVMLTYLTGTSVLGPAEIVTHVDPDGLGIESFGPPVIATTSRVGAFVPIPAQAERKIDAEGNLAWDLSDGEHRGRAYLVYTDSPDVGSMDTNVFVRYSDDNGLHWSAPVQVHEIDPLSQFLPSIAVDASSGNVGVGWYSADDSQNVTTNFFVAISDDGGATFRAPRLVSPGVSDATDNGLDEKATRFQYGDYTGIAFNGGMLQPIWADNSLELADLPELSQFELANARVAIAEVSRAMLQVQTVDFQDVEGNEFTTRVATFTDPVGGLMEQDYHASIRWGDGSDAEDGIVKAQPDGSFSVLGTHEFEKLGRYAFTVTIKAHRTFGEGGATAVIENAPLDLVFIPGQRVVRQTEFSTVVATLTDLNRHSEIGDFVATIDWGDGATTLATLELQVGSGVEGQPNFFNVSGTHEYLSERDFTIKVSLRERSSGKTLDAQGGITSGDPVLVVEPGKFLDINALERVNTGDLELVTFSPAAGANVPLDTSLGEYTATINWGDGNIDTNVKPFVTSTKVTVVGRHTYNSAGQYFPFITLVDDSGGFFAAPLIAMVQSDVTSRLRAVGSGLVHNPVTDKFVGELTITNSSQTDVSGPLYIVVHGLPAGVTLDSFPTVTGAGDPLIKIDQGRLPSGSSLAPIALEFSNPARIPISYTVQVFDGLRSAPQPLAGLAFEPNRGQANEKVSFVARGEEYAIGLNGSQAAIMLARHDSRTAVAAIMEIVGGGTTAVGAATEPQPGVSNYLSGGVAITDVPRFGRVRYPSVYHGVDIEYYGRDGQLEYDWIVRPGANPGEIAMRFRGVDDMSLDHAGNLRLRIDRSELVQQAPVAYQIVAGRRVEVASAFAVRADGSIGFTLGDFDHSVALVIDPVLVYSTYLGGAGNDSANAVAVDNAGNSYVAGLTGSLDFFTANPFDRELNQPNTSPFALSFDAFVSKIDSAGGLVFSTYLGGGGDGFTPGITTVANSIAIDDQGHIWVAGDTLSRAFPRTTPAPAAFPPAIRPTNGGGFLTELSNTGSSVLYSTVLDLHSILDIAIDDSGAIYTVGLVGIEDVFGNVTHSAGYFAKIDPVHNTAPYVGFVLGVPKGIAVDMFGQAYVAGFTSSPAFPTKNALNPSLRTRTFPTEHGVDYESDGFVFKLFADGQTAFSTFLGNTEFGSLSDIAVDSSGTIYVVGATGSDNMPTPGGLQISRKGGGDIYFVKLANDGSELLYGTYLGGSGNDLVYGIAVDAAGRAYIAGSTNSLDFPQTVRANQPHYHVSFGSGEPFGFGNEGFAAAIEADGRSFKYLTYLGGSEQDEATAVAVDAAGNASFVGVTNSPDLLIRNAVQPHLAGAFAGDAFITRLLATDAGSIDLHISPFTVTEGNEFNGLVAFFSTNGVETADQFSAVIDWGDGTSSPGVISGDYPSGFQILGRHVYADQIGTRDFFVTLLDSLGRTVTAKSTPLAANATARYHVAIDTASLAGAQARLSLQFNPGSLTSAPDATARVTGINAVGGSLGNVTQQGNVVSDAPGNWTLRATDLLNRTITNVTLGSRIEFDVELSLASLANQGVKSFTDIFAAQLLNTADASALLDFDSSASLLRIEIADNGATRSRFAAAAATVAASGRATIANAPIDLKLVPFTVQEGLTYHGAVARFTNGNPFETAGQFRALIDWGDHSPATVGEISGSGGAFEVIGSHVYETIGAYKMIVTVLDPDGAQAQVSSGREILAASQFQSFLGLGANGSPPVVGDFTGDGILDVVVAGSTYLPNFNGPGVGILRGKGDGSFEFSDFRPTAGNSFQLVVADFNGDGKLDVAAAPFTFSASVVELLLGNGDGTLQPSVRLAGLRNPVNLAAADFNRDGKVDLAYVEANDPSRGVAGNQLRVAIGRGDGTFDNPSSTTLTQAVHSIRAADMTGDTTIDLVVMSSAFGSSTINLLRGIGDGTFGAPTSIGVGVPASSVNSSIALGDFDVDGKPDVAIVDFVSLRVIRNVGDGAFVPEMTLSAPGASSVAAADFDGDGRFDIAVGEGSAGNDLGRVRVFYNDRSAPFTRAVAYEGVSAPLSVLTADFDRDGHADIATSGNSSVISVLASHGEGGFASAVRYATGLSEPRNLLTPKRALTGDVNGDSRPDTVLIMSDGRIVSELGGGNGVFQPRITSNAGPLSWASARLADVNRDGKLDLVAVNQGGNVQNDFSGVSLLIGNGDGSFAARQFIALRPLTDGFTTDPTDVAVGDVNGDGIVDLAVSLRFATAILIGNADGTYQSPVALRPPAALGLWDASQRVALADMDGDGDRDLVTFHPSSTDGAVAIWRNNGIGQFNAPAVRNLGIPFNTFFNVDMAVGDLNGDGRVDVVASDVGAPFSIGSSGGINVMLGLGDGTLAPAVRYQIAPRRRPYQVALADLNGDGRPDIVSPVGPNGSLGEPTTGIAVLINNGQGAFALASVYDHGGDSAGFVSTNDFNGDGQTDIVVPHFNNLGSTFSIIYAGSRSTIVTDAPVVVTGSTLHPRVGLAFDAVVATFIDENPFSEANDFTAQIDWGDGQTSPGIITALSPGLYAVAGAHAYSALGAFKPTITVTEIGESVHRGVGLAQVSADDAALIARGLDLNAEAGTLFFGGVATFSDMDPNGGIADFSARIHWGDSQTSAGSIQSSNGGFRVVGSHTYLNAGEFAVQVDIFDIGGSSSVAMGTASVAPRGNHAPVADDDVYLADEDSALVVLASLGVLANDADADLDPISARIVSPPTHGMLTLAADGSFIYLPNIDFSGLDSFSYVADDGRASSEITTASIRVRPVDDPPRANNDAVVSVEDTAVTFDVLLNDVAGDHLINPAVVVLVGLPQHGIVRVNPTSGAVTYTPFADFAGSDRFSYRAGDVVGLLSNEATVEINVGPRNDPPLSARDSYATLEDTPLTVSSISGLLANDFDADHDTLSAILITPPAHGTLTLQPDGSFTYSPAANFFGVDKFTYRASDGRSESTPTTVSLLVGPINDAPAIAPIADQTIAEGARLSVDGVIIDSDSDAWTATVNFGDGTNSEPLTITGKSFRVDHLFRESGQHIVTVRVIDASGAQGIGTFRVIAQNIAPAVQVAPEQTALEGAEFKLSATFIDPGVVDTHASTIDWGDGTPPELVASPSVNGSGVVAARHFYADDGEHVVTIRVADDEGGFGSATLRAKIGNALPQVNAGPDRTILAGESVALPSSFVIDLSETPVGPRLRSLPSGSFVDAGSLDRHSAMVDWGDGTIEVVPVVESPFRAGNRLAGTSGAVQRSHVYASRGIYTAVVHITDDDGGMGEDSFVVTVKENPNGNTPPRLSGVPTAVTIVEERAYAFTATASDDEQPAASLTFSLIGSPVGATIDASSGQFAWTPTDDQGRGVYVFDVQVSDGIAATRQTIAVTVVDDLIFHVTNTNDSGLGSLRQALDDATYSPGHGHTILFEIPGLGPHKIEPVSSLPALTDMVIVELNSIEGPQRIVIGAQSNVSWNSYPALSLNGPGSLTLGGVQNYSIGATIHVNPAATLELASDAGGNLAVSAAGDDALVALLASQHLTALSLSAAARAELASGGHVLIVQSLSIEAASGSFLDLTDGAMVVDETTGASELPDIVEHLRQAMGSGQWDGSGGITSSVAFADSRSITGLGLVNNRERNFYSFVDGNRFSLQEPGGAGEQLPLNSILVKYTYFGDEDLSGVVDGDDVAMFIHGFHHQGPPGSVENNWELGDFDYNGRIDGDDLVMLLVGHSRQGAPLANFAPSFGNQLLRKTQETTPLSPTPILAEASESAIDSRENPPFDVVADDSMTARKSPPADHRRSHTRRDDPAKIADLPRPRLDDASQPTHRADTQAHHDRALNALFAEEPWDIGLDWF